MEEAHPIMTIAKRYQWSVTELVRSQKPVIGITNIAAMMKYLPRQGSNGPTKDWANRKEIAAREKSYNRRI